jgi:hypothetical protein
MSTLREEYEKKKQAKEKVVTEAAVGWVKNNVILLNEKINRKDIERLVNSISDFQKTFEPCYEKVPSIKSSIDNVETGLHGIITGKRKTANAVDMLKYMSFVYNTLSSFFQHDVNVLCLTPVFALAVNNPDVPMRDLSSSRDMVAAFRTALKPDSGRAKLLKAIYKNSSLPELDIGAIASELSNLSLNDLKRLQGVEKVPLIATEPERPVAPATASVAPTAAPAATSNVEVLEVAPVAESALKSSALLTEDVLFEAYLNEAIDINVVRKLTQSVQELQNALRGKGLPMVERGVSGLAKAQANAVRDLASQGFFQQQMATAKDFWNMIGNSSEKGSTAAQVIKQTEMALKTFEQLKAIIPDLLPVFMQPELTADNFSSLQQTLRGALKGGLLSKITSFFGTKPFPGLEPDKIITDIINLAKKDPQNAQAALEQLANSNITSIQIPTSAAAPKPATTPQTAVPPTEATASAFAKQTELPNSGEGGVVSPNAGSNTTLVQSITKVFGGNEATNAAKADQFSKELVAAGWTPPKTATPAQAPAKPPARPAARAAAPKQ